MHKKEINLALIAARQGSKGVKNKNLLNIKNKSITRIAVEIAVKLKNIDNVIKAQKNLINIEGKFYPRIVRMDKG